MNKQNEAFYELKRAHLEMTVPDTLDDAIRRGIIEGRNQGATERSTKSRSGRLGRMHAIAVAAAAMLVLIVSLNLSPAFAEQLSGIPFLGQLVKVLIFRDGSASGGTVTDGSDISAVSTDKSGTTEYFTIHFEQGDQPQELAGAYAVQYAKNPDTLSFQISGVRMFSAVADFAAIKSSALVEDVYPIITMDDSMIRFMIVFKEPVVYAVKEMKNPASLVLQVSPGEKAAVVAAKYRVRTAEMPNGESLGITEEMLMHAYPQRRILHVSKNSENYFIELGQFESQEAAESALKTAKTVSPDIELFTEALPVN